jgi:hypothetical protein
VMVTAYSAFFYHYADFPAPWIALSLGGAAGALAGHRRWSKVAMEVFAVLILLVTVLQVREMYPLQRTGAQALASQIPPGACLVTDEVSLTIAADRFARPPAGCPDIIDSLADTLVLSNGVSVQGGAQNMPAVVAQWQTWLSKADYVLLSPGHASQRRIPWTNGLWSWFNAEFVPDGAYSPATPPPLASCQVTTRAWGWRLLHPIHRDEPTSRSKARSKRSVAPAAWASDPRGRLWLRHRPEWEPVDCASDPLRTCRLRQRPEWEPVTYAIDTNRPCQWRSRQVDDPVNGVADRSLTAPEPPPLEITARSGGAAERRSGAQPARRWIVVYIRVYATIHTLRPVLARSG